MIEASLVNRKESFVVNYNSCTFLLLSMCLALILYVFVFDKRLNEILTHIERIINIYEIFNYLMNLENNRQMIAFKNYRDQSLVTVVIVTTVSHGGL